MLVFVFLGRKISLRDRLLLKETLNQDSVAGLVVLDLTILRTAIINIMIGAILIAFRFIPHMGLNKGLFFVLFHAVTVFGFDRHSKWLSRQQHKKWVCFYSAACAA
jgi:trk system potassium uptake protein TrkH